MKRQSFLNALVIGASFVAFPFKTLANRINKGIKVAAGKDRFGKPISLLEGDIFTTKVSSQDTNGDLYIYESIRVKKGGVPLHYHYEQDEWWYVLEGEFLIKVGDESHTAKAGDFVFCPRMVPHAFAKTNDGSSRLLMGFQPAGKMEAHFTALSEGIYTKLNDEEKKAFRHNNGFEVVGPALGYDKTKN